MDERITTKCYKVLLNSTSIKIIIEYQDNIRNVLNKISSVLNLKSMEDHNFYYMNKNLKYLNSKLSFMKIFHTKRLEKENITESFENYILVENKYTSLNISILSDNNTSKIKNKSYNFENICYSNNNTEEILSHKNKLHFLFDKLDQFLYLNPFRLELSSHQNYFSNLKLFTYQKNDFINIIRFPLYGLLLNRFSIIEENLKEIEILKIIHYITNEIKITSMEITMKYLSYINHFEDLEILYKLEELKVYNPESKIYSTKEFIENSNIFLSEGKFLNLKSLLLENCDIQILDNIIYSSRNLKSIHLKNVSDIKEMKSLGNIKSFTNIETVILEYKEIAKLNQILDLLSSGFVLMNLRLSSLTIIIDSIDLELGFSFKKLENFKLIQNTETLMLDLNCLLSDNFDKPLKLNFLNKILKKIKIKPYSQFKLENFDNLFQQNTYYQLNEIKLDNVEIFKDARLEKAIEDVIQKNVKLKKIKINRINYNNLSRGNKNCKVIITDNTIKPFIFTDSKKLTINFSLFNEKDDESIRFISILEQLPYSNGIDRLVIEDIKDANMNLLQFLSINLRNLKEIKISNAYLNTKIIELIKKLIDNNSRLTALKFIKITDSKLNKEEVEEFFDWIFYTANLSRLIELKFCYLNFSSIICNKFLNSKLPRQLEKISFSNLKNFTFFEDSIKFENMERLKFISIKNVETKLEDLLGFFIFYSNQIISIRIDVNLNLLDLFLSVKFPNLIELEISDNLFKYTQIQKENIINAIDSLYLRKLPFNFKNLSREFKLSINKKFKCIKT